MTDTEQHRVTIAEREGMVDADRQLFPHPPSARAVEQHRAAIAEQDRRIAACDDRLAVNRASAATQAHAAMVLKDPQARKALDDLDIEHERVSRDLGHHRAARATAVSLLAEAERAAAAEAECTRAEQARAAAEVLFAELSAYRSAVEQMLVRFQAARKAFAVLHPTGFGPVETQITRWMQRLAVMVAQNERLLKFEDPMLGSDERRWLERAPHDWLAKLEADTGRVLGETDAEAAE